MDKIKTAFDLVRKMKFAAMVLLAVLLTSSFVGATATINVYLDDLPSSAYFVVKTDGTNTWAVKYDGDVLYESTNASYTITSAINVGGEVHLASGIFTISTYIYLNTKSNITISGEGQTTIVKPSGDFRAFRLFSCQRIRITSLTIDQSKTGTIDQSAIYASYSDDVTVDHLYITDANRHAIQIGTNCDHWIVSDNNIYNPYAFGVWISSGCTDIVVDSNIVENYGDTAIECMDNSYGITFSNNVVTADPNGATRGDGIGLAGCHDVSIIGNRIKAVNTAQNKGLGIFVSTETGYDCYGITISGNTIEDATQDGIFIGHNEGALETKHIYDVTISGNTIKGAGESGIDVGEVITGLGTTKRVTCNANTINGSTVDGITIEHSSNCSATSNIITNSGSDGIEVHDSSNTVLTGNICGYNTGYGVNETGTSDYTLFCVNNVRGNTAGAETVDAANSVDEHNLKT